MLEVILPLLFWTDTFLQLYEINVHNLSCLSSTDETFPGKQSKGSLSVSHRGKGETP